MDYILPATVFAFVAFAIARSQSRTCNRQGSESNSECELASNVRSRVDAFATEIDDDITLIAYLTPDADDDYVLEESLECYLLSLVYVIEYQLFLLASAKRQGGISMADDRFVAEYYRELSGLTGFVYKSRFAPVLRSLFDALVSHGYCERLDQFEAPTYRLVVVDMKRLSRKVRWLVRRVYEIRFARLEPECELMV